MSSCSLILLRGMPAFHNSMAALLSASEKDLTPLGMLAVDWDQCEKLYPLYSSEKNKKFLSKHGDFVVPCFGKDLSTHHY